MSDHQAALLEIYGRAIGGVSTFLLPTTARSSYTFEWTEGVFQNTFRPSSERCMRHSCPIYHAKGTHNADLVKITNYTDIKMSISI